jgi:epidermal growth factor receptor substrate 15
MAGYNQGYTTPPQGQGWMTGAAPTNQLPFTAQELPYYQQLWSMADVEGKGFIDGASGAQFLECSGIPRQLLSVIWSIADSSNQGSLTRDQFFVALRLVAHVQAGRQPAEELVLMECPQLPEFEGLQRRRNDGEVSDISPRPPSVVGGASDTSDLQPVIAEKEEQVQKAAEFARHASPTPRRAFDRSRWAPTQREKRKYASLFLRTDWKKNGVVEAAEAKMLLERARLDTPTLAVAWEHADRDCDGRLTFPEFVALTHLISCVKRGAAIPGLQEGLPPELLNTLSNLHETPEDLAAQRSRSPSPSGPSGVTSPAGFLTASRTASPAPHYADPEANAWNTAPPAHDAFAGDAFGNNEFLNFASDQPQDSDERGFDAFGNLGDVIAADEFGGGKKEKKKKKDRKDSHTPTLSKEDFSAFETQPKKHGRRDRSAERDDREDDLDYAARSKIDSATEGFLAVIEADRAVSKQIRGEVDVLEEELRHVRDAEEQLSRQVRQERQRAESLAEERRRLEGQVEEYKRRLAGLTENRRAINLESISLRRDREHFASELAFLEKMSDEEESTLQALRHTNTILERSYHSLEGQTEQLERQRRELVEHVAAERDEIRKEERRNSEIKNRLDRLKREQIAATQSRRQEFEREQQREEMQRGMENPATAASRLTANPISALPSEHGQQHSWAHAIISAGSGAKATASGSGLFNDPMSSQSGPGSPLRHLVATGSLSREGV